MKVYRNLLNGACSDSFGVLGYLPGSPNVLPPSWAEFAHATLFVFRSDLSC